MLQDGTVWLPTVGSLKADGTFRYWGECTDFFRVLHTPQVLATVFLLSLDLPAGVEVEAEPVPVCLGAQGGSVSPFLLLFLWEFISAVTG